MSTRPGDVRFLQASLSQPRAIMGGMTATVPRRRTPGQLSLGAARLGAGDDGAFHPAVAEWFRRRFPEGPTRPQAEGWSRSRPGPTR